MAAIEQPSKDTAQASHHRSNSIAGLLQHWMRSLNPRCLGCPILASLGWESTNLNQLLSSFELQWRRRTARQGPNNLHLALAIRLPIGIKHIVLPRHRLVAHI